MELKTIFLYTAVINFSIVIVTMVAWLRNRHQKDIVYWFSAACLIVVAGIIMAMRDLVPFRLFDYAGATIYVVMNCLIRMGFKEFLGQHSRLREPFIVAAISIFLLAMATLVVSPLTAIGVIGYLGPAVYLAFTARLLWRSVANQGLPSLRLASLVFAAYAVTTALNVPMVLLDPVDVPDAAHMPSWISYSCILQTLMSTLCFFMAVILKLERSGETQRHLAERDALTGIINRRTFLDRAEAIARSVGGVVAIIDLDHFKRINDTYGHKGGDDALIQFTECMREHLPDDVIFGRLGGEEFALCLPGYSGPAAGTTIERLRQATARKVFRSGDNRFALTFSCGLTVISDAEHRLEIWVGEADAALYAAKDAGRNTTVVYEPSPLDETLSTIANSSVQPDALRA